MKYTNRNIPHVLINVDIEHKHLVQLCDLEFANIAKNAIFYINILLNCDIALHPYNNYMELHSIDQYIEPLEIELTADIWYNLVQMCYQHKILMLDGEVLATDLPVSEVPRFYDVWGECPAMYSDIRQELRPG